MRTIVYPREVTAPLPGLVRSVADVAIVVDRPIPRRRRFQRVDQRVDYRVSQHEERKNLHRNLPRPSFSTSTPTGEAFFEESERCRQLGRVAG